MTVVLFMFIALLAIISGFNGGGNLMATFVASGTMSRTMAVLLLFVSLGIGPWVFGTAVSRTIAIEVVNFHRAGHVVFAVAVLAAVMTVTLTWWLRIPTSTTIALGGGMVGAAILSGHSALIHWDGVVKLLGGLFGSLVVGFVVAYGLTVLFWAVLSRLSRGTVNRLAGAQYVTAFWQGLAYGANDQEKIIGLMALFFMLFYHQTHYVVLWPAILLPLLFWGLGVVVGGWRIAKTVGGKIYHLRPMNALSTQAAAALTVSMAALWGFPVSTTETTDGALFGMGSALNPYKVRWPVVRKILVVWVLTMPTALAIGSVSMIFTTLLRRWA